MIFTVYRLELFKMRKRLATWITYLCFLGLSMLVFGVQFYSAKQTHGRAYFGFPDALPGILTQGAGNAGVFAVVLIVLMTCSEFDWKTSRQNIIDGLSKTQWFIGKALLIPTVILLLYLTLLTVGGTLAYIGTSPSHLHAFDPAATYFLAACGVLLAMTCYASIALLIAVSVRSTGPALAIVLIYQVFDLIAAMVLRGLHLNAIADWLPFQIHGALVNYGQYHPPGFAPGHVESHWHTGTLFLAAAAWIVGLLCISYRVYMKRDL